jgi:hypothetical protein
VYKLKWQGSSSLRGNYLPADWLFLLVSVLPEAFLTLVRCHFVLLSFLSAWHIGMF